MIITGLKRRRCEAAFSQLTTVINLAGSVRCDRDFLRSDLQLAVFNSHQVVAYLGPYRHFVAGFIRYLLVRYGDSIDRRDHVGLCADIRDRAVFGHHHCEGMIITGLKLCRFEAIFSQRTTVIYLAGSVRCDRDFLRCDLQFAIRRRHQVVAYRSFFAGRHGYTVYGRDYVGLCANVRDRAVFGHRHCEGMSITGLQIRIGERVLR